MAALLSLGMMLAGCGKTNGGSTGITPGGSAGTTGTGSTEDPGNSVKPEKPAYEAGIVNLSSSAEKLVIPDTPMQADHGKALSKSGTNLLQKAVELSGDKNENILLSPISIQMALGMTATGSDPDSATRKGMMNVLFPGGGDDPAVLNEEMATFAKRMTESEEASWNVANSIWANENGGVKLSDTFVRDATNYYHAELYSAPFNEGTKNAINQWVKENTRERIPEILKELSPEALLVLVNALAFDGEWAVEYETDQINEEETFRNADGSEKKVAMLHSEESRAILLADGVGFIKPYKGGQYSFVGILPPEGMSTEEYVKKLASDPTAFSEAYLHPDTSRDVYAGIPEFKTEYGLGMDDVLLSLGMKDAYEGGFGKMVTTDSVPVKISTVIHKTMIEVDRHGTKAAAATVVVMDEACAEIDPEEPYYVILNRPFVYAIVDNESGVPLFLGVQNTME